MNKGCLGVAVIFGGLILLGLILVMYGIGFNNSLIRMNEGIDNQWAQIDNQLLRRSDLIPNLVNTVKGYAKHEQEIFTNLNNARNQLLAANTVAAKAQAAGTFEGALNRLMAVVENYPNLKADQQFLRLQDELAGTENRLAYERKTYNDLVREYNTKIKQFPGAILAGIFGAKARDYFEVPEAAKQTPVVDFGS
ncbi:MAG: LemA family protein [Bacteroidota bacterium]